MGKGPGATGVENNNFKHGMSRTSPIYSVWREMCHRCRNPSHAQWKDYGGRGISVCDRWKGEDGFMNFLSDMGERPDGLTLERKDNNGNYEPGNCVWASRKVQAGNRRQGVPIQIGDFIATMQEWCTALRISPSTFHYRVNNLGETAEQALRLRPV